VNYATLMATMKRLNSIRHDHNHIEYSNMVGHDNDRIYMDGFSYFSKTINLIRCHKTIFYKFSNWNNLCHD
jgi:hypothetical protein